MLVAIAMLLAIAMLSVKVIIAAGSLVRTSEFCNKISVPVMSHWFSWKPFGGEGACDAIIRRRSFQNAIYRSISYLLLKNELDKGTYFRL